MICPQCQKGHVIERKPSEIVFSTAVIVIRLANFTSWDKPVGQKLQNVTTIWLKKKVRGGGKQVVCSNGDYEEEKVKQAFLAINLVHLTWQKQKCLLKWTFLFYHYNRQKGN